MCEKKISPNAKTCPSCGEPMKKDNIYKNVNTIENKNTGIAVILSFVFPGLGQLYNGQIGKGFFYIIRQIVLLSISYSFIDIPGGWGPIFILGVIALVLWIKNIFQAKRAK